MINNKWSNYRISLAKAIKCFACGNEFKFLWNESSIFDLDDCLINSTKSYGEICEAEICVKSLTEYQYRSLSTEGQSIKNTEKANIVRYCSYQLHRPDFLLNEKGEAVIIEEIKGTVFFIYCPIVYL